jgi:hypothetical protein
MPGAAATGESPIDILLRQHRARYPNDTRTDNDIIQAMGDAASPDELRTAEPSFLTRYNALKTGESPAVKRARELAESFVPSSGVIAEGVKGIKAGTYSLGSTIASFGQLASAVADFEGGQKFFGELAHKAEAQATREDLRPAVPSYRDVDSASSLAKYLASQAGQVFPSIVESTATGVAGALISTGAAGPEAAPVGFIGGFLGKSAVKSLLKKAVAKEIGHGLTDAAQAVVKKELTDALEGRIGAAALSPISRSLLTQEINATKGLWASRGVVMANSAALGQGEVYQNLMANPDIPESDRLFYALTYGLAVGSLDMLPNNVQNLVSAKALALKFPGLGQKQAKHYLVRVIQDAADSIPSEAITEGLQEVINIAAEAHAAKKEIVWTRDNVDRVINSAIGGAAGVGISSPFSALVHRKPPPTRKAPKTEDTGTEPPATEEPPPAGAPAGPATPPAGAPAGTATPPAGTPAASGAVTPTPTPEADTGIRFNGELVLDGDTVLTQDNFEQYYGGKAAILGGLIYTVDEAGKRSDQPVLAVQFNEDGTQSLDANGRWKVKKVFGKFTEDEAAAHIWNGSDVDERKQLIGDAPDIHRPFADLKPEEQKKVKEGAIGLLNKIQPVPEAAKPAEEPAEPEPAPAITRKVPTLVDDKGVAITIGQQTTGRRKLNNEMVRENVTVTDIISPELVEAVPEGSKSAYQYHPSDLGVGGLKVSEKEETVAAPPKPKAVAPTPTPAPAPKVAQKTEKVTAPAKEAVKEPAKKVAQPKKKPSEASNAKLVSRITSEVKTKLGLTERQLGSLATLVEEESAGEGDLHAIQVEEKKRAAYELLKAESDKLDDDLVAQVKATNKYFASKGTGMLSAEGIHGKYRGRISEKRAQRIWERVKADADKEAAAQPAPATAPPPVAIDPELRSILSRYIILPHTTLDGLISLLSATASSQWIQAHLPQIEAFHRERVIELAEKDKEVGSGILEYPDLTAKYWPLIKENEALLAEAKKRKKDAEQKAWEESKDIHAVSRGILKKAFHLDDDQAEAAVALAKAMGIPLNRLAIAAPSAEIPKDFDGGGILLQLEGLHASYADILNQKNPQERRLLVKFIGNGQGTASFGWGIYIAQSPAVAKQYQDEMSDRLPLSGASVVDKNNRPLTEDVLLNHHVANRLWSAIQQRRDVSEDGPVTLEDVIFARKGLDIAIDVKKHREAAGFPSSPVDTELEDALAQVRDILYELERNPEALKERGIQWKWQKTPIYKVSVDANVDELLDWDAPLGEQPDVVKKAIDALGVAPDDDVSKELNANGGFAYNYLVGYGPETHYNKRVASKALRAHGVKGIRYKDQFSRVTPPEQHQEDGGLWRVSGGSLGLQLFATRDEAQAHYDRIKKDATYNYVIFDDKLIHIVGVNGRDLSPVEVLHYESGGIAGQEPTASTFFQGSRLGAKAMVAIAADGRAIIWGFKNADFSSFVHEMAHVARLNLLNRNVPAEHRSGITDGDIKTVEDWAGAKDGVWSEAAEEKFARGFERFLYDGGAENATLKKVFAAIKKWMNDIYKTISGSAIDIEITPEVRAVMAKLVTRGLAPAPTKKLEPATEAKKAAPEEEAEEVKAGKKKVADRLTRVSRAKEKSDEAKKSKDTERIKEANKELDAELRALAAETQALKNTKVEDATKKQAARIKESKAELASALKKVEELRAEWKKNPTETNRKKLLSAVDAMAKATAAHRKLVEPKQEAAPKPKETKEKPVKEEAVIDMGAVMAVLTPTEPVAPVTPTASTPELDALFAKATEQVVAEDAKAREGKTEAVVALSVVPDDAIPVTQVVEQQPKPAPSPAKPADAVPQAEPAKKEDAGRVVDKVIKTEHGTVVVGMVDATDVEALEAKADEAMIDAAGERVRKLFEEAAKQEAEQEAAAKAAGDDPIEAALKRMLANAEARSKANRARLFSFIEPISGVVTWAMIRAVEDAMPHAIRAGIVAYQAAKGTANAIKDFVTTYRKVMLEWLGKADLDNDELASAGDVVDWMALEAVKEIEQSGTRKLRIQQAVFSEFAQGGRQREFVNIFKTIRKQIKDVQPDEVAPAYFAAFENWMFSLNGAELVELLKKHRLFAPEGKPYFLRTEVNENFFGALNRDQAAFGYIRDEILQYLKENYPNSYDKFFQAWSAMREKIGRRVRKVVEAHKTGHELLTPEDIDFDNTVLIAEKVKPGIKLTKGAVERLVTPDEVKHRVDSIIKEYGIFEGAKAVLEKRVAGIEETLKLIKELEDELRTKGSDERPGPNLPTLSERIAVARNYLKAQEADLNQDLANEVDKHIVPAFYEISPDELANVPRLMDTFASEGRTSAGTEGDIHLEHESKKVVYLLDKQTGKVIGGSFLRRFTKGGAFEDWMIWPENAKNRKSKWNRRLPEILAERMENGELRYVPIASARFKYRIRKYYSIYDSVEQFEKEFAEPARDMQATTRSRYSVLEEAQRALMMEQRQEQMGEEEAVSIEATAEEEAQAEEPGSTPESLIIEAKTAPREDLVEDAHDNARRRVEEIGSTLWDTVQWWAEKGELTWKIFDAAWEDTFERKVQALRQTKKERNATRERLLNRFVNDYAALLKTVAAEHRVMGRHEMSDWLVKSGMPISSIPQDHKAFLQLFLKRFVYDVAKAYDGQGKTDFVRGLSRRVMATATYDSVLRQLGKDIELLQPSIADLVRVAGMTRQTLPHPSTYSAILRRFSKELYAASGALLSFPALTPEQFKAFTNLAINLMRKGAQDIKTVGKALFEHAATLGQQVFTALVHALEQVYNTAAAILRHVHKQAPQQVNISGISHEADVKRVTQAVIASTQWATQVSDGGASGGLAAGSTDTTDTGGGKQTGVSGTAGTGGTSGGGSVSGGTKPKEPTKPPVRKGVDPRTIEAEKKYGKRPPLIWPGEKLLPTGIPSFLRSTDYPILTPHQRVAVNYALHRFLTLRLRAFMLADGTGVGKTMTELVVANEIAKRTGKKVLIVTPSPPIIRSRFLVDMKRLGIDLTNFEFSTYDWVRRGAETGALPESSSSSIPNASIGDGDYGVVVFDEVHNMKNLGSGKTLAALDVKADHELLASATPFDKPGGAVVILAKLEEKTIEQMEGELGMIREEEEDAEGKITIKHRPDTSAGYDQDRIDSIIAVKRDGVARNSGFIRRFFPVFSVNPDQPIRKQMIGLSDRLQKEQEAIMEYWEARMAEAKGPYRGRLKAMMLGELARWVEPTKAGEVIKLALNDIRQGKKVVIFADGINDTRIKGLRGRKFKGFINTLTGMLDDVMVTDAKGVRRKPKWVGIFGRHNKEKSMDAFQNGDADIVIATARSGGVGIDLDDQIGHAPRMVYIVTADYAGDVFDQVLGRVSRMMTKSPVDIRLIFSNDAVADRHHEGVLNRKFRTLNAMQHGTELDATDLTASEEAGQSGTIDEVASIPEGVTVTALPNGKFLLTDAVAGTIEGNTDAAEGIIEGSRGDERLRRHYGGAFDFEVVTEPELGWVVNQPALDYLKDKLAPLFEQEDDTGTRIPSVATPVAPRRLTPQQEHEQLGRELNQDAAAPSAMLSEDGMRVEMASAPNDSVLATVFNSTKATRIAEQGGALINGLMTTYAITQDVRSGKFTTTMTRGGVRFETLRDVTYEEAKAYAAQVMKAEADNASAATDFKAALVTAFGEAVAKDGTIDTKATMGVLARHLTKPRRNETARQKRIRQAQRVVAILLERVLPEGLRVVLDDARVKMVEGFGASHGDYDLITGDIALFTRVIVTDSRNRNTMLSVPLDEVADILIHEAVHAASSRLIYRYNSMRETLSRAELAAMHKLEELWEEAVYKFREEAGTKAKLPYGLTNLHEFLALVLDPSQAEYAFGNSGYHEAIESAANKLGYRGPERFILLGRLMQSITGFMHRVIEAVKNLILSQVRRDVAHDLIDRHHVSERELGDALEYLLGTSMRVLNVYNAKREESFFEDIRRKQTPYRAERTGEDVYGSTRHASVEPQSRRWNQDVRIGGYPITMQFELVQEGEWSFRWSVSAGEFEQHGARPSRMSAMQAMDTARIAIHEQVSAKAVDGIATKLRKEVFPNATNKDGTLSAHAVMERLVTILNADMERGAAKETETRRAEAVVARALVRLLKHDDVPITLNTHMDPVWMGTYNNSTSGITLYLQSFRLARAVTNLDPDDLLDVYTIQTLIHECIHAVSSRLIHRYNVAPETLSADERSAMERLQQLYDEALLSFRQGVLGELAQEDVVLPYELTNLHEFVAFLFDPRRFSVSDPTSNTSTGATLDAARKILKDKGATVAERRSALATILQNINGFLQRVIEALVGLMEASYKAELKDRPDLKRVLPSANEVAEATRYIMATASDVLQVVDAKKEKFMVETMPVLSRLGSQTHAMPAAPRTPTVSRTTAVEMIAAQNNTLLDAVTAVSTDPEVLAVYNGDMAKRKKKATPLDHVLSLLNMDDPREMNKALAEQRESTGDPVKFDPEKRLDGFRSKAARDKTIGEAARAMQKTAGKLAGLMTETMSDIIRTGKVLVKAEDEFAAEQAHYADWLYAAANAVSAMKREIRRMFSQLEGRTKRESLVMQVMKVLDPSATLKKYGDTFHDLFGKDSGLNPDGLFEVLEQLALDPTIDFTASPADIIAALKADPAYAELVDGSLRSVAMTASIIAFAKTHMRTMAAIELRKHQDGAARVDIAKSVADADRDVYRGDKRALVSSVGDLKRTATIAERYRNAHLKAKVDLRNARRAHERLQSRLKMGQAALKVLNTHVSRLNAGLSLSADFEFLDKATVVVPPSPDATREQLVSEGSRKTLRLSNKGTVTNPDEVEGWLLSMKEFMLAREERAASGDEGALDSDYEYIKRQFRILADNHHIRVNVAASEKLMMELGFAPVWKKIADAFGTGIARAIMVMGHKFQTLDYEFRNTHERYGRRIFDLENHVLALMPEWVSDKRAFLREHMLDPVRNALQYNYDLEEKYADNPSALTSAIWNRVMKMLMDNEGTKHIVSADPEAWRSALKDLVDMQSEFMDWAMDKVERSGIGVEDESLKVFNPATGKYETAIRRHIPKGSYTFPQTLHRRFKMMVRTLRDIGWSDMNFDDADQLYENDRAALEALVNKFYGGTYKDTVLTLFLRPLMEMPRESAFEVFKVGGDPALREAEAMEESGGDRVKYRRLLQSKRDKDTLSYRADPYLVRKAFDESGGNVIAFAENLHELTGSGKSRAEYVAYVLNRLGYYYKHADHILKEAEGDAANDVTGIENMSPDAFINPRVIEDLPGEWFSYYNFDQRVAAQVARRIAAQTAFGRGQRTLANAWRDLTEEVQSGIDALDNARREVDKEAAGEVLSASEHEARVRAKLGDVRYKTLVKWEKRFGILDESKHSLSDYFRRDNHPEHLTRGLFMFSSTLAGMMVNQIGSAIAQLGALVDLSFRWGAGSDVLKAVGGTVPEAGVEIAHSLVQAIGLQWQNESEEQKLWEELKLTDPAAVKKLTDVRYPLEGEQRSAQVFRGIQDVLGFAVGKAGGEAKHTLIRPFAPFSFSAIVANKVLTFRTWKLAKVYINRAMEVLDGDPDAEITGETMGYTGLRKDSFMRFDADMKNWGLDLKTIAKDAIERRERGDTNQLTNKTAIAIHAMMMSEVSSENNISTMPLAAFNNSIIRFSSPLLGWSWRRMVAIPGLRLNTEGRNSMKAALGGIAGLGITFFGGLFLSAAVDSYYEKLLRRRRNVRLLGGENPVAAAFENVNRIGTFGLFGDAINTVVNTGQGGDNRGVSVDSRIIGVNSLLSLFKAGQSFFIQGDADYAGVIRPLAQAAGGGGALQYIQMVNNLADLDNAESRFIQRLNARNWLRITGRDLKMDVRQSTGGYSVPTKVTPWLGRMELATYGNDPGEFSDAYQGAIEAAREAGHDDPRDYVQRAFSARHPLRTVFRTAPSEGEYRRLLSAMSTDGADTVSDAVRVFNHFGLSIGIKPFTGTSKSRSTGMAPPLNSRNLIDAAVGMGRTSDRAFAF